MKALEFYFDFQEPKDAPPILLDVFDADCSWFKQETKTFLGRAVIHLETKNN